MTSITANSAVISWNIDNTISITSYELILTRNYTGDNTAENDSEYSYSGDNNDLSPSVDEEHDIGDDDDDSDDDDDFEPHIPRYILIVGKRTSYHITGLFPSTQYSFKMAAISTTCIGPFSADISFITL